MQIVCHYKYTHCQMWLFWKIKSKLLNGSLQRQDICCLAWHKELTFQVIIFMAFFRQAHFYGHDLLPSLGFIEPFWQQSRSYYILKVQCRVKIKIEKVSFLHAVKMQTSFRLFWKTTTIFLQLLCVVLFLKNLIGQSNSPDLHQKAAGTILNLQG